MGLVGMGCDGLSLGVGWVGRVGLGCVWVVVGKGMVWYGRMWVEGDWFG